MYYTRTTRVLHFTTLDIHMFMKILWVPGVVFYSLVFLHVYRGVLFLKASSLSLFSCHQLNNNFYCHWVPTRPHVLTIHVIHVIFWL